MIMVLKINKKGIYTTMHYLILIYMSSFESCTHESTSVTTDHIPVLYLLHRLFLIFPSYFRILPILLILPVSPLSLTMSSSTNAYGALTYEKKHEIMVPKS